MQRKYSSPNITAVRAGLTLLELVVVLVILAALAALIVPRLSGVASQANTATNASVVEDVNRSVGLFEARYNKQPSGWDSLLTASDAYFSKLHPNLTQTTDVTKPKLQIVALDAGQAQSLQLAGITGFHDADEARVAPASDNSTVFRFLSSGKKVVMLVKDSITSGHGSTFIDKAFSINQYRKDGRGKQVLTDYEYVVAGLGGPTSIKGMTMQEIPLVQSANPVQYYARVLVVYKIPIAGATDIFPAEYVGSFLPDGTSLRSNVDSFNNSNS